VNASSLAFIWLGDVKVYEGPFRGPLTPAVFAGALSGIAVFVLTGARSHFGCPFWAKPKTKEPETWVRPELVCEVRFRAWTWSGEPDASGGIGFMVSCMAMRRRKLLVALAGLTVVGATGVVVLWLAA
jgi:hypothetical protein